MKDKEIVEVLKKLLDSSKPDRFIKLKYKDKEFQDKLRSLNPDIILMAGFHRKIPPQVFSSCKDYCVNIHPSLF